MEDGRSALKIQVNLQQRDLQESLDGDERILLEWILKKWVSVGEIGLIRFRIWIALVNAIGKPCDEKARSRNWQKDLAHTTR